jgi:cell cycle checkpoint control protein RAD9A
MICAHGKEDVKMYLVKANQGPGVTKVYQLTYESTEVVHALFDRNTANNQWTTRAIFLKEFSEYFSPKAEQLDMYLEDGKVTFLSFTDKIVNSKNGQCATWCRVLLLRFLIEILKNPLRTAVSVSTADFAEFEAQEKLHIIISVKDFKAIVSHAATINASMSAYYSRPGRPLQFTYTQDGMTSNFTLMTAGDYGDTPTPSADTSAVPIHQVSRAPFTASTTVNAMQAETSVEMPPPAKPDPRRSSRRLGQNDFNAETKSAQQMRGDPESLFVPAEDDNRWDPPEYENDEESMGWDASVRNVRYAIHLTDMLC